ncbi:MAG: rhodanese-related sulfurtransferase [Glaciimonas sp.]|nr:rhodanese-related sulfurtransferase [Glaciimonas sp.]
MNSPVRLAIRSFHSIREDLLARREIALLDVREEASHALAHPLFAANLPLGRIELDAYTRIPRRTTPIVVFDDGDGLAELARRRLQSLGYTDIALLEGGLDGWRAAGGELFQDVNAPSKAFGELVASRAHTPSLSAQEVKALLDSGDDVVVLDARRFDEYQNMSIPGSISVPGAELVLRARALAPRPDTQIIVNCAGRTRSIIGTQSLLNAGLPNRVHALRNGTIGWTLAGQTLEHGQARRFGAVDAGLRQQAALDARQVAQRAGVKRISVAKLEALRAQPDRTTYLFDVRTPEEYVLGHLPGFLPAPGGQLVQETEANATVRGARIVLADDDGVRANMTASWLAQMAWEVYVLDGLCATAFSETGNWQPQRFDPPQVDTVNATTLSAWLQEGKTVLLDFTASANYVNRHIPGAWFALRSQLAAAVGRLPAAERYVVTCGTGLLARYAVDELRLLTGKPVVLLEGGTAAWTAAGLPLESGATALASPRIDRYRRPYEGTDNAVEAMQAYLDWEFGLVEQLRQDGSHGFFVLEPAIPQP